MSVADMIPSHPADTVSIFTPTVTAAGMSFAKIDGTWCGQTQAGTWRPVRWLHGASLAPLLLDHLEATT